MTKYTEELREDLKRYVKRELNKGHSINEIKQVLLEFGHHPTEVKKITKQHQSIHPIKVILL